MDIIIRLLGKKMFLLFLPEMSYHSCTRKIDPQIHAHVQLKWIYYYVDLLISFTVKTFVIISTFFYLFVPPSMLYGPFIQQQRYYYYDYLLSVVLSL